MAKVSASVQNTLSVRLLELRRHLKTCRECRTSMKTRTLTDMCEWTQRTIIEVAIRWDGNITGRLAARNGKADYIFPCPDPNRHGSAYALTAEACMVTAIQDTMI